MKDGEIGMGWIYLYLYLYVVKLGSGQIWGVWTVRFRTKLTSGFWTKVILAYSYSGFRRFFCAQVRVVCVLGSPFSANVAKRAFLRRCIFFHKNHIFRKISQKCFLKTIKHIPVSPNPLNLRGPDSPPKFRGRRVQNPLF